MENTHYAGFWIRLSASLIDTVIFIIVLGIPFAIMFGIDFSEGDASNTGFIAMLLQYVAPIVITVWFWVKYLGTPGKMLLKLQVVDADTGHALSTPQAIGRYLGYYISTIPLMLGFIWVAFDRRKQGFHDKLARTVVIHTSSKTE
ncbi:MAG: putative RDD family membrane protein YckC [Halioglobus sp.]|jgi:uncharacterized RDD family membrane protein YckC